MKISLAEINSKVGDLKYNANLIKKHADIAYRNGAEILITPELSLCGYPPEDLLLDPREPPVKSPKKSSKISEKDDVSKPPPNP